MSDVDNLVNAMAGLTAALEQNRHGAYAAPAPAGPDPFAQAAAQVLQQNPNASLEDVMGALGGQPQAAAAGPSVAPEGVAELRAEVAQLREATTAMHADLLRIGQAVLAMANVEAQRASQEPAGAEAHGAAPGPTEPHGGSQGGLNGTAVG